MAIKHIENVPSLSTYLLDSRRPTVNIKLVTLPFHGYYGDPYRIIV